MAKKCLDFQDDNNINKPEKLNKLLKNISSMLMDMDYYIFTTNEILSHSLNLIKSAQPKNTSIISRLTTHRVTDKFENTIHFISNLIEAEKARLKENNSFKSAPSTSTICSTLKSLEKNFAVSVQNEPLIFKDNNKLSHIDGNVVPGDHVVRKTTHDDSKNVVIIERPEIAKNTI